MCLDDYAAARVGSGGSRYPDHRVRPLAQIRAGIVEFHHVSTHAWGWGAAV